LAFAKWQKLQSQRQKRSHLVSLSEAHRRSACARPAALPFGTAEAQPFRSAGRGPAKAKELTLAQGFCLLAFG
jgi:hypothetical protein